MSPASVTCFVLTVSDTRTAENDTSGQAIRYLLEHAGHHAIVASGYTEALRFLVRVPADVLLCDLGLPDGDGLDLASKAKALRPKIRTIALTARASLADKELGRQAGFDHYLTKPFDFHQLRTLLP